MGWGIPSVVGPLFEWLDYVPVEGCWPGATVVVQTDDASATVVARGTSGGGRDLVPVVAGTRLKPGERLVAKQIVGGDSSALTQTFLAVSVGASPTSNAQLPPVAFRSRLYACGAAVWLTGAAPGAVVAVTSGGAVLGDGRADAAGNARLRLSGQLPAAGTAVSAEQAAPPGFGPLGGAPQIAVDETIPLPLGRLPKPVVKDPVPMGCESSVCIGSVIDGAAVTVTRESDGWAETVTFDLEELWFVLSKSFPAAGDRISVSQAMPHCEVQPSDMSFSDINPARAPEALEVTPPCAGSGYVHVAKLRPGATLTVAVDGREPLQYRVPPERTAWDVPVEPVPSGVKVTVRLTVCGFWTSSSVAVVDELPPPPPKLVEPLYSCGRVASVETRASAYLELWADLGAARMQISQRVRARTDLMTIGVFPFLSVPESVWAHQLSCSGAWLDSPKTSVKAHPRLDPLELQEPVEGEQAVLPTNVVSGAHVTVWAASREHGGQAIIGERDVTGADPVVGLARRLTTDDVVWAVQEMCGQRPEQVRHYNVIPGTMQFVLPAPKDQSSGESIDGKVIVHSAELACRFLDGAWILFADVENTEPGYDCSIVLGVDLGLTSPLVFGENLDVDVAANGGLPDGLSSLGYPSHWTATKRGTDKLLQNLAFWKEVLNGSAIWKMMAAWNNYAAPPDTPDWVKGKNVPPDPNQLFPPIPADEYFPGGDRPEEEA